jgi:hypothetical protein
VSQYEKQQYEESNLSASSANLTCRYKIDYMDPNDVTVKKVKRFYTLVTITYHLFFKSFPISRFAFWTFNALKINGLLAR